jgi:hypothetical protein
MVLEEAAKKLHQFLLTVAVFGQKGSDLHLVGVNAVARPAHVTALFFMLDEQAVGVSVEYQAPAVLVSAFRALVERLSQQGHVNLPTLR